MMQLSCGSRLHHALTSEPANAGYEAATLAFHLHHERGVANKS